MTQPLDRTRRLTRRRSHPIPPRPPLSDRTLLLACALLRANGAVVLEPDWRHQTHRLGVVAHDGSALCFVAVVPRNGFCHTPPEQHADQTVRARLRTAAGEWLRTAAERPAARSLRFDLIDATLDENGSFSLRLHKGVA